MAVRWLDSVESTQDAVHALAEAGAPAGTALAAREQLAGRGSRGRTWASPPGGLWLSVLLRPDAVEAMEALSLRVGLALIHALERAKGTGLALKWPNDIMADGRKAGGILCEARWNGDRPGWVTVGVGLNVRNPIPPELAGRATRLAEHGITSGPEGLAEVVAEAIMLAGASAGPLTTPERVALADRDWLVGRALAAPVDGIACGILADGALQVRRTDGSIAIVRAGPVAAVSSVTLAE